MKQDHFSNDLELYFPLNSSINNIFYRAGSKWELCRASCCRKKKVDSKEDLDSSHEEVMDIPEAPAVEGALVQSLVIGGLQLNGDMDIPVEQAVIVEPINGQIVQILT